MTPLHLMTIVGTRPEIIRLSAVIRCCDRYFRQTLVHTGQNWDYTLHGIFFQDLGLRPPDRQLHVAGSHLGQTLGNVLSQSYQLLQELRPDAVLLLGDTNSCLSAISAKRLQIPIFHMEAGNRCFDSRVPEEINRRIVDVTADYHLCYTEHARRNLLAMGLPPDRIFVTGSPMPEVLSAHLGQIQASPVLERLGLEPQGYFLLSAHREENIDTEEAFLSLLGAVNCLAEQYGKPVLYACHPRAKKRLELHPGILHPLVRVHPPLGFHDYNRLQLDALCVLSDSGTLPEESSFFRTHGLPFPAVSLRPVTERPEALERGAFLLSGVRKAQVLPAVEAAISMAAQKDLGAPVPDYPDEKVSGKVAAILQSYATQDIRK